MSKKVIKILLGFFLIFFIGGYVGSRDTTGYLYIEDNRGEADIFSRERLVRTLLDSNLEKVDVNGLKYINGAIYVGLPNGDYYLKNDFKSHNIEVVSPITKDKKYQKVRVEYSICEGLKKDKVILTISTIIVTLLNLIFFYMLRGSIKTIAGYTGIFALLVGKMIVSNETIYTSSFVTVLNAGLSSVIGLSMLYYYLKNKNIKLNIFATGIIMTYGLIDIIFLVAISSGQIFSFLYTNNFFTNRLVVEIYKYIDFPLLLFLIILLYSLKETVTPILLKKKIKKEIIVVIFLILSILSGYLAHKTRLYVYIDLYNYMFAYWLTLFFQIKNFSRNLNYVLRMFMYLLMFYIFFYYTNDTRLILIFVGSFFVVNIIAYLFTGMIRTDYKYIEEVENRFVLIDDLDEFKYQVKKELEKTLFLQKIKVLVFFEKNRYEKYLKNSLLIDDLIIFSKDFLNENLEYDSIIKLSYGKNRCVGLILIKNQRGKLLYEEEKYLIELSKIASKVASRIRLNKLQEELRCTK